MYFNHVWAREGTEPDRRSAAATERNAYVAAQGHMYDNAQGEGPYAKALIWDRFTGAILINIRVTPNGSVSEGWGASHRKAA